MAKSRQVALLRGVNVGGHAKVPMARLREVVEELGYEGVRTHLQSGNVVFTTATSPDQAARALEKQIAKHFDLTVPVLVRTGKELSRVVDDNPLRDIASNGSRFLVMFLGGAPNRRKLAALDASDFEPDVFHAGKREIYVWCPNGLRDTKLGHAFWEKQLGLTATGRNWNTVTKLLELAES
jgi:uncharacterized protein (DUF1697 family)